MKRFGVKDDVKGVPWKLPVWLAATVVEALSRSPLVQAFAAGVSDASMAIYIDQSIANKTLVAGDEI